MTLGTARVLAKGRAGRYYRLGRSLYCVEQDFGEHLLMEDCRSGELVAMPARELHRLLPVVPAKDIRAAAA